MASAGRQSQRRKGSVTPPDLYGHMRTPDSLSGDASGSDVTVFAPGDVGSGGGGGGGNVIPPQPPPDPGGGGGVVTDFVWPQELKDLLEDYKERIEDLEAGVQALQLEKSALVQLEAFLSGTLAVTTGAWGWYAATGMKLRACVAIVETAPTGATLILDVTVNGVTLFATAANRPTIAIAGTVATTTLPDTLVIEAGDYVTLDILQVGSTIAGADLRFALLGYTRRS